MWAEDRFISQKTENQTVYLRKNTINQILPDSRGQLWVASSEGLFTFDGFGFSRFEQSGVEKVDLGTANVLSLASQGDSLFIGTDEGLFILHIQTQHCRLYQTDSSASDTTVLNSRIECMALQEGGIWMGSWLGVSYLDFQTGKFSHIPIPRDSNSRYAAAVRTLLPTEGGLWYGTWSGDVYMRDLSTGNTRHYPPEMHHAPGLGIITSIHDIPEVGIVVSSFEKGLTLYQPDKDAFLPLEKRFSGLRLSSQRVHDVWLDQDGHWWIGTENGITHFDPTQNKSSYSLYADLFHTSGMAYVSTSVTDIWRDPQGGSWFATPDGLVYNHPSYAPFQYSAYVNPHDIGEVISAFTMASEQLLIHALQGTYTYDLSAASLDPQNLIARLPIDQPIFTSAKMENGDLLLGGTHTLYRYRPAEGKLIQSLSLGDSSLVNLEIRHIIPLAGENVLVSKRQLGFHLVDFQTGAVKTFKESKSSSLVKGDSGRIWSNSLGNLSEVIPETHTCKALLFEFDGKPQTLGISAFIHTKGNKAWGLSQAKDLLYLDLAKQEVLRKIHFDRFQHEPLLQLAYDRLGALWVLTAKALYRYDLERDHLRRMGTEVGLSPEAIEGSLLSLTDANVCLIKEKGIFFLPLEAPVLNQIAPQAWVSSLTGLDGTPIVIPREGTLSLVQRDITLHVSCDNYLLPSQNRFFYRLTGYKDKWEELQASGPITYQDLPDGTYQFELVAANNDGIRGAVYSLRLQVANSSWQRSLLVIAIIGVLLIGMGWRYRLLHWAPSPLVQAEETPSTLPPTEAPTLAFSPLPVIQYPDRKQHVLIDALTQYILLSISDTDITADDLAREVGLSKSQLYRKVKAITDQSVNVFIRNVRLDQARELMEVSQYSVREIAYEVGFGDPSYFGRLFKKRYGMSPSQAIRMIRGKT